jgi:hypothetical protein
MKSWWQVMELLVGMGYLQCWESWWLIALEIFGHVLLLGTTRQRLLSRGRQHMGESGFGSFGLDNTRGVFRMSVWHSLSM